MSWPYFDDVEAEMIVDPEKVRAAHARLVDLGMLREQLDPMSPPREIPTTVRELVRRGMRRV